VVNLFEKFLIEGVEAALGEKCGLQGKSVPLLVVEGTMTFLAGSLSFPMMTNK
jgi:hypothetical protein